MTNHNFVHNQALHIYLLGAIKIYFIPHKIIWKQESKEYLRNFGWITIIPNKKDQAKYWSGQSIKHLTIIFMSTLTVESSRKTEQIEITHRIYYFINQL
jgi:hypothetical protein